MANLILAGTDTPLDRFALPEIRTGREVTVRTVLPSIEGENYCVLTTELDIRVDGEFHKIDNLDALFSICQLSRCAESLEFIRRNRTPTEATHRMARSVSNTLIDAAANPRWLYIRCRDAGEEFLWQVDASGFLGSEDLIKYLPHLIGEYEVTDESATWYLRVRDDDPFIFLAGPKELIDRIDADCSKFAMRIPGDFAYEG